MGEPSPQEVMANGPAMDCERAKGPKPQDLINGPTPQDLDGDQVEAPSADAWNLATNGVDRPTSGGSASSSKWWPIFRTELNNLLLCACVMLSCVAINSESIHAYVRYLDEVIGFFIVEDRIMQSQPSLVTIAHKDQLWEMALQQVTGTMNSHFGNCLDVEMMLKMKKVILLFILTMKSYGYNTNPLYILLQNFRDQYNEILMREYCAQFETALQSDNYTPITVYNDKEYRAVIEEFPYKRPLDKEEYPRKFPFSQFVPTVFTQAKGYLLGCLRFMENLELSQSEVNDTVRRSLIQLIQITINMGYLERSCEQLETYISKIRFSLRSEQLIDEALKEKVSAFLEISNYDWELAQPNGVASDYVTDLLNFLNTTFTSFTNLPNVLAKHVCMQQELTA
uniref:Exocyst complex subunit Sec15 C-terminal domain-containing protein n=1 Tax=Ditylenchus dipsaci TaxID=166011 RepID=A0A915DVH9_9BILA